MNGASVKASEGLMGADGQGKYLADQRALASAGKHQLSDCPLLLYPGPSVLGEGFSALKLGCLSKSLGKIEKNLPAGAAPIISQTSPVM